MSAITIVFNEATKIVLELARENEAVMVGYRDVWFDHSTEDMLDIVAEDIVNRVTEFKDEDDDEEDTEAEIVVVLDIASGKQVLRTVIDANALELGEALIRFCHFFANIYTPKIDETEEIVDDDTDELDDDGDFDP